MMLGDFGRGAYNRFSGCSVPDPQDSFYTTFLNSCIVVVVKTPGPQYILRLCSVVCKGMLPVKHLAPT